jgi:arsenate reductase
VSEQDLRKFLELLPGEPKNLIHPGALKTSLGSDVNIENFNTPEKLIGLLLEHPEVMNRPVCIRGNRAVIARPEDKINEILD